MAKPTVVLVSIAVLMALTTTRLDRRQTPEVKTGPEP